MTKIEIDGDAVLNSLAHGNFDVGDNPYTVMTSISSYVNSLYKALEKIEESWESAVSKVGLYVEDFREILLPELELPTTDFLDEDSTDVNSSASQNSYVPVGSYSGSQNTGNSGTHSGGNLTGETEKPTEDIALIAVDEIDKEINVFSNPSEDNNIICTLTRGEKVTILDDDGSSEWVKIRLENGQTGYIQRSFINIIPSTSNIATVTLEETTSKLEVWNTPSSEDKNNIVNYLKNKENVEVLKEADVDGWVKIKLNDSEGYVQSKYLTIQEDLWEEK